MLSLLSFGLALCKTLSDDLNAAYKKGPSENSAATAAMTSGEEGPDEVRCFVAFTAEQPLSPETDFNVLLDATESWQGTGDDREAFFFTTGTGSAVSVEGQPRLDVTQARDETTDCGWEGARVWDLTLTAASGDLHGLSLLHVYSVDEDNATLHVATRGVPTAGGLVTASVARDVTDPWTDCFVAIQENARGERSVASEISCWDGPIDSGESNDNSQVGAAGGCGCSGLPGPALPGGTAVLLCYLAWGVRRDRIPGARSP